MSVQQVHQSLSQPAFALKAFQEVLCTIYLILIWLTLGSNTLGTRSGGRCNEPRPARYNLPPALVCAQIHWELLSDKV